ncbi:transposase [Micromonospora globbae]|uniref:transposase n=1 Tax=Micromonospora globbae TaxID=1894969 RepID=UPI003F4DEF18
MTAQARESVTRVHLGCEQGRKRLSMLLTLGHRADSPQFIPVLAAIRVPRLDGGRPRCRPDRVLADRAYSSKANGEYLRRRGIHANDPDQDRGGCRLGLT